jgi:hypothetical protein
VDGDFYQKKPPPFSDSKNNPVKRPVKAAKIACLARQKVPKTIDRYTGTPKI